MAKKTRSDGFGGASQIAASKFWAARDRKRKYGVDPKPILIWGGLGLGVYLLIAHKHHHWPFNAPSTLTP